MARKLPPGHKLKAGQTAGRQTSSSEYIFALDDSGPTDPILNRHGKFSPVAQPFTVIGVVALNKKYEDSFRSQWNCLRSDIQSVLACDELPSLHARLMFGKSPEDRPASYREKPNPYRQASAEQVVNWYLQAMEIIGSYTRLSKGGTSFANTFWRQKVCATWENAFRQPDALAEAEFMKVFRRRRHPDLHRRYIAAVTSVFTIPTLDTYYLIEELLRRQNSRGTLLLDPFTDAVAFDDEVAFEFVRRNLNFQRIMSSKRIEDTDSEPLLQAADFVAYTCFRQSLSEHRSSQGSFRELESFISQGVQLIAGEDLLGPKATEAVLRVQISGHGRAVRVAARYAIAYNLLLKSKKESSTVEEFFITPDDFMMRCHKAVQSKRSPLYIPILKDGVLEKWEASGRSDAINGEDHP